MVPGRLLVQAGVLKHSVTDCRGAQASPRVWLQAFRVFGVLCMRVSDGVNKKTKINLPKQHIPRQYMGHLFLYFLFLTLFCGLVSV